MATARTLYSLGPDGVLASCGVLSRQESAPDLTLVTLDSSRAHRQPNEAHPNRFVASAAPEAGRFNFLLGGGRKQEVTGGASADRFFLLDAETHARINGHEGEDTLDLSRAWQQKPASQPGSIDRETGEKVSNFYRTLSNLKFLIERCINEPSATRYRGAEITDLIKKITNRNYNLRKMITDLTVAEDVPSDLSKAEHALSIALHEKELFLESLKETDAKKAAEMRVAGLSDILVWVAAATDFLSTAVQRLEIARGPQSISELAAGVVLDLSAGAAWLRKSDGSHGMDVALIENVENLTGTGGDDALTGDAGANVLDGLSGNDHIVAGAGNDILRGRQGNFDGGSGRDSYQLWTEGDVNIHEEYAPGAESNIRLRNKAITDIAGITRDPDNSAHLLIRFHKLFNEAERSFMDGGMIRLHNFCAPQTGAANTHTFHITTRDGYLFSLKSGSAPPDDLSPAKTLFMGTFTAKEREDAEISLSARDTNQSAVVEITETFAGKREKNTQVLPDCFDLILENQTASVNIKDSERSDLYRINDREVGGLVTIDNYSIGLEMDKLLLPWAVSETGLKVVEERGENNQHYRSLQLQHRSAPEQHVRVLLRGFMDDKQRRHLELSDPVSGQIGSLDITPEGVAVLADGPLTMNSNRHLEVLATSGKGAVLNGRDLIRSQDGSLPASTVITDSSGHGNTVYGNPHTRNRLEVRDGNSVVYGGDKADELHSDRGSNRLEAADGNDAYYVKGSAVISDSGGEDTLVLEGMQESRQSGGLWFRKTAEKDLSITFSQESSRMVTAKDYFSSAISKVEHIVAGNMTLSNDAIDGLVSAMAALPEWSAGSPEGTAAEQALAAAHGGWQAVISQAAL